MILVSHLYLPSAIFSVFYQRQHIISFASVMFLCHSLLSSSFDMLNLSCTFFLSLYSAISWVTIWSCVFAIFISIIWHSTCQFAIYNRCRFYFCHVVLSCSSVVLRSFSSVIVFCHVILSCSSVIFFCRLHLAF